MKEFYRRTNIITVDEREERRNTDISWVLREVAPSSSSILLTKNNYEDMHCVGMYHYSESFFKHRPFIRIRYFFDDSPRYYLDEHRICIETRWKVATDLSLNEIIKYASAQDTIEYLKERGMTACPFNQGE